MLGETIRSVQCHQKVGCLFRKRIWSILRKVHSIESEKGKEEWNEKKSGTKFMFLNFCYCVCGGIERFSSLFGNHFSRFCACMSVCNGEPVLVRGDSAQESCRGICEADSQMSAESSVTHWITSTSLCLPTARLLPPRKALSFSHWGWESEGGKLLRSQRKKVDEPQSRPKRGPLASECSFWDFVSRKTPGLHVGRISFELLLRMHQVALHRPGVRSFTLPKPQFSISVKTGALPCVQGYICDEAL